MSTDFSAELILVCNSLDAGGIERVVATLANEWSRRGRKVCVVTLHSRRNFYELDPNVHHVVIDRANLNRLVDLVRWLAARLPIDGPPRWRLLRVVGGSLYRAYQAAVYAGEAALLRRALGRVDSPVVVSLGTPVNIITLKACRGLKRRLVISERNDPKRLRRFGHWDALARKFYNRADLVTANTRGALHHMSDYVEPSKLAFVPNPLVLTNDHGDAHDPAPSPPKRTPSQPASPPFILNVARMVQEKAHDVLLEAFALFGEDFAGWRLALVGDGRREGQLRAQAAGLGVERRVDWHGVVRDPFAFYRAARIFALPSRVEGTPNALLEAMSCGLPVVVSDGAPGLLELVEDEVTGLVVPVNDAAALAEALRRLAADPGLGRRLGERARERVAEYDLPRALAAWESVIGLAR